MILTKIPVSKFTFIALFSIIVVLSTINCQNSTSTSNHFSIKLLDSVQFRRSYFGRENWPVNEDSILSNRNPDLGNDIRPQLKSRLESLGIMYQDSLVLAKFQLLDSFPLVSKTGTKLKAFTSLENNIMYLTICKHEKIIVKLELTTDTFTDIKLNLSDFVTGGYEEIIVVKNYYIMNGDNFDIFIYELKDND
jgi:hypothetical protein